MLKRLLLRVSSNINLNFDVPLQQFAAHSDFWTVDITANNIQSFKIADDILLRHVFIILKGLEEKKCDSQGERELHTTTNPRLNTGNTNSSQQLWFQNQAPSKNQRDIRGNNTKTTKKLRV
ncbi:unnamed protein product [Rotaria magnacalcarata]|uniref:Uncharacterized protein n=1 Tax=Rotaria magnacalcarata TaxID=392030 RepID=A0A8S3EL30_9BILA|nr:unnamed protein product [Rotaria magnacalcarata]